MKVITKRGSMTLGSAIGKLLTPTLTLVAAATVILPTYQAAADAYTVIDVSTAGSAPNQNANGALFSFADPRPTGTGFIDPFLREQNSPTEAGVNTDIKAQIMNTISDGGVTTDYNNKDPINYTHDLVTATLIPQTGGFFKFALDANQVANGSISLIRFQIFTSNTKFTDAAALGAFVSGTTGLAFDMNGGATKYRVDITSNSGSGSGDMTVLVPSAGFTGTYTYLVCRLVLEKNSGGFASNDGFEEWTTKTATAPPTVPDGGSTLLLLGSAFASLGLFGRGRKSASIA